VRAAVGPRAAISLRARGDGERARRVEAEAAALRRTLGWTEVASWVGTGDPRRLGLAVPLSGRTAIVGEEVLRGAMMALGEGMAGPDGAPAFELAVRDTAPERDTQGRAAEELVRAEAVVGLLGGGEAATVADAAQDGVPLLSLTDVPPGSATTAFQVIHAAEARAAELARRAAALGARSFAILGPDSASGKRLAEAFAAAVRAQGGRVVAQVTYVAGTTSFGAPIGQLKRAPFDALFVPDDASRLELVAPALAFADVTVQPSAAIAAPGERGTPGARGGARRGVLLLSTARALSRQLLRNSGRYVQGALLAPGFFPAAGDPRAGGFVGRFRDLFGKEPTAIEAYSYDAVRMMTALVERGARTRSDLLRMLQTQGFEGITGTFRFGPDHGRLDPPPVYVVEGDEIKALR
jgi:ABC-type branched-subunit amino acid transport system substrate-binding protein